MVWEQFSAGAAIFSEKRMNIQKTEIQFGEFMIESTLRFETPRQWSLCVLTDDCDETIVWFSLQDMRKGLGYKSSLKANFVMLLVESTRSLKRMAFVSQAEAYLLISKSQLLTEAQKTEIIESFQKAGYMREIALASRQEIAFVDILEQELRSWGLRGQRQYKVGKYRIDFYVPSIRLAVEFDENGHKGYSYAEQEGRQKYIEERLGCAFVRVSDVDSTYENLGTVLYRAAVLLLRGR